MPNLFRFRFREFARSPGCLSAFLVMMLSGPAFRNRPRPAGSAVMPVQTQQKTALVELFTSEGCSSCPAADRLLPELRESNVFVLEFNVDYWDKLGWKDPFSDQSFSARQRGYAHRFHLSSLYTPEAVINGETEWIGSDRQAILHGIGDALGKAGNSDEATLELKLTENNRQVKVGYAVSGRSGPANATTDLICLALVQKNAVSKIGAGENGGRILNHINIVRELKTAHSDTGVLIFTIPAGQGFSDFGITGWIQEKENGIIKTVTAAGLK